MSRTVTLKVPSRHTLLARVLPALAITALLVVVGIAIGRQTADHGGAKASGVKQGIEEGRISARHEYDPGQDKYIVIYDRGKRSGRRAGRAAGFDSGAQAGGAEAFGGYSGWDVGRWYAVHIGQPSGSTPYTLSSRVEMDSGQFYNVCPSNSDKICGGSIPGE